MGDGVYLYSTVGCSFGNRGDEDMFFDELREDYSLVILLLRWGCE